jgi:hypothetical protein
MDAELLEQAKQNCVARAERLMEAELTQVKAKYQSRLNPSETLILLEAIKLQLQESKSAFGDSDTEKGLELFSIGHSEINRLASRLITSSPGY